MPTRSSAGSSATAELLLPRVAAGEADAVRTCIDRFGALVWSLTRRMLADKSRAEDAVQEIFIDIWKSAGRYDPAVATEATFIATIARRRLIDARRRAGARPEREALDASEIELAVEADDGLAAVELRDEAQRAERAIEQLRPAERQVLMMSIRDGLSQRDIAKRIHMPLGTVKSHMRRGLERASALLGGRTPDLYLSSGEATP